MKTKLTFCLLALLFALTADAQKTKGVAGAVRIGYMAAPGSETTFGKIAPYGISGFTNSYAACGGDAYFRTGNIILGLDGLLGAQGSYSYGNQYAEPFVGAGHARFGYIVRSTDRYWIYPSLGTGTSFTVLTTYLEDDDGDRNDIDNEMLVSPSFDLGINADLVVNSVAPDRKKYGAFILGFRAGYRGSFRHSRWIDGDGDRIKGMPNYGNNAFYATLSIGGGWFYKKS